MTPLEYWASGAGMDHITPPRERAPESSQLLEAIRNLTAGMTVLDFGCGPGRLAHLFEPLLYEGVDVCPAAIEAARAQYPSYGFTVVEDVLPSADVVFANNVLMHMPDADLPALVARFRCRRVIISEVLGRKWRGPGLPPVFNRELGDYIEVFSPRFRWSRGRLFPCAHYPGTDQALLEFRAVA